MHKLLPVSIFICISVNCFAQGENNQWCFGNFSGLDFNSGSPVSVSSQVSTTEGSSSIADAAGNLLFYSDGITVWNKNHTPMPNGMGLYGGGSSTQSALIVGQPQTPSIYYVFTTAEAQGINGFCYSIVDMTLQGGLGDVTTKNVQLFTPSAEKVCATKHSNGIDIWVLGHEMGTNNFVAYLLTSAGLGAPIITSCGTIYSGGGGVEVGYMKFSPDGSQLAHAMRYLYSFELDSFNTSTGIVSAPLSWPSTNSIQAYGIEFSNDGALLYTSDDSQTSQYDIQVHDVTSILASKTFISTNTWALQMGPDDKLYIAEYTASTLSVINDPDIPGLGCNYVSGAVALVGTSTLGLPNQISSINGPPVAIFSAPNHICPGTCTDFTNLSVNASSFIWQFPGANPAASTDANPTQICYNIPGQYTVTLIATNVNGVDTLSLPNFITVYPQPSPQGILQSGDTLFANQGATSYQWYHDGNAIAGATEYFYVATQSGNFNVVATDVNGCEVEAVIFDVVAGISQLAVGNGQLAVFPNPVSEKLNVNLHQLPGAGEEISIYNVFGEKMYSEVQREELNANREMYSVNCKFFPSGLYYIEVVKGEKRFVTKFTKE
jgi:PKD repeat protein